MTETSYHRLYHKLKLFIPEPRLITDPLQTLAYGTDGMKRLTVDDKKLKTEEDNGCHPWF